MSKVKDDNTLVKCPWCIKVANVEHMMFGCSKILDLCTNFAKDNKDFFGKWLYHNWLYGVPNHNINTVVWVFNFFIYKSTLCALEGYHENLRKRLASEFAIYECYFPSLLDITISLSENGVDSCTNYVPVHNTNEGNTSGTLDNETSSKLRHPSIS